MRGYSIRNAKYAWAIHTSAVVHYFELDYIKLKNFMYEKDPLRVTFYELESYLYDDKWEH